MTKKREVRVFLSYARNEGALMLATRTALQEHGVTTVGDWDIDRSHPDFPRRLRELVDEAEAFAVLLSGLSTAEGSYCLIEMGWAEAGGKRVVPIRIADHLERPAVARVPETIRRINWPLATTAQQISVHIVEALNTDLDLLQLSAELGSRASEWVRNGGPSDQRSSRKSLLGRADLERARDWSRKAAAQAFLLPRPSVAIEQLIEASERRLRRLRAQILAAALGLGLLLSLLTAYALRQASLANERTRTSDARRLAIQAGSLGTSAPIRRLLLSVESVERTRSHGEPVLQDAKEALIQALAESRGIAVDTDSAAPEEVKLLPGHRILVVRAHGHPLRSWAVADSGVCEARPIHDLPDGRATQIAVAHESPVFFSGWEDGKVYAHHLIEGVFTTKPIGSLDEAVVHLRLSRDGASLAAASNRSVGTWPAKGGAEGRILRDLRDPISDIAINDDGTWLLTCNYHKTARLRSIAALESGAHARELSHSSPVRSCIPHDRGFATVDDVAVRVWSLDASDGPNALQVHAGRFLAWSPRCRRIAMHRDDSIRVTWSNTEDSDLDPILDLGPYTLETFAPATFVSDRYFAVVTGSKILYWDLDEPSPTPRTLIGHEGEIVSLAADHKTLSLASASKDGTVRQWRLGVSPWAYPIALPRSHRGGSPPFAYSPTGKYLAAADRTGVEIWSIEDAPLLHTRFPVPGTTALAFDSGGDELAIGTEGGALLLRKLDLAAELGVLRADGAPISQISSADGTWLTHSAEKLELWDTSGSIVASEDSLGGSFLGGQRHILNVAGEYRSTLTLSPPTGPPLALGRGSSPAYPPTWSSSQEWVAWLGPRHNEAQAWFVDDLDPDAAGRTASEGGRSFSYSAISADGTWRLGRDQGATSVSLFSLTEASGERELQACAGGEEEVQQAVFSPDSTMIATGTRDGSLRVWALTTGEAKLVVDAREGGRIEDIAWSADSSQVCLACWNGTVAWYRPDRTGIRPESGRISGFPGVVPLVATSREGDWIACAAALVPSYFGRTRVHLMRRGDTSPGRTLAETTGRNSWLQFASSQDRLLTATTRDDSPAAVQLWSLNDSPPTAVDLSGHRKPIHPAFSPDGTYLLLGEESSPPLLWHLTPEPKSRPLTDHVDYWSPPVFSPDSRCVAYASNRMGIVLQRLGDPAPLYVPTLRNETLVALTPTALSAMNGSGLVTRWDVAKLTRARQPTVVHTPLVVQPRTGQVGLDWLTSVAVGEDPAQLIAGGVAHDGEAPIWIWSLPTERGRAPDAELLRHREDITQLTISPERSTLASADSSGLVCIWTLQEELQARASLSFRSGPIAIDTLQFAPGGQFLVTGSAEPALSLWDLDLQRLLHLAKVRCGRNLNRSEWNQHLPGEPYHRTFSDLADDSSWEAAGTNSSP